MSSCRQQVRQDALLHEAPGWRTLRDERHKVEMVFVTGAGGRAAGVRGDRLSAIATN